MQTIYTIHAPDSEKLEHVIAEMRERDDLVDADSLDWQDYLQAGQQYTAAELAGEVRGHGNCSYSFDKL